MSRRAVWVMFVGLLVAASAFPIHTASAANENVTIKDNEFLPRRVEIDPGDTVTWTNQGRNTHTVTSDDRGEFNSGELRPGQSFTHKFNDEGYYYYHCKFHGSRGKVGQWGVVVVGNPEPPDKEDPGDKDRRTRLVVPDDFRSIQKAVDVARPGSAIVIKPGVYKTSVVVTTNNLLIKGVDRFRTILDGRKEGKSKRINGFLVDGADNVTIANLTTRYYRGNGVFFNNTEGYRVTRVDAIINRTYGIYVFDSYNGIIEHSFAYGSGDGAFYIGQCLGCGGLIQNVHAEKSYLGYSGTNATGVTIRDSTWVHNGAGIVPNTLPTEDLGPNRGTLIYNNVVKNNNYSSIPAAGFSDTIGIPYGTGIWLAGVQSNLARDNLVTGHDRYGILVSQTIDEDEPFPFNNRVRHNTVRATCEDSNSEEPHPCYDLAWDGTGASNCFTNNDITGDTSHPEMQVVFACANRPFPGVPQPEVQADLAYSASTVATRAEKEPPYPDRPRCQIGAPGCRRGHH